MSGTADPMMAVGSQAHLPTSFTCRGRTMRDLSPSQSALAHLGQISPELKANSPVYYWQKTLQRRSRHEALCQKDRRWHLTTFGSHDKFEEKAKQKCASVNRLKKRVVDSCTALTLSSLPKEWAQRHGVVVGTRGVGYWRWKAYTILQRLSSMEDGEVPLHLARGVDQDLARKMMEQLGVSGPAVRAPVAGRMDGWGTSIPAHTGTYLGSGAHRRSGLSAGADDGPAKGFDAMAPETAWMAPPYDP